VWLLLVLAVVQGPARSDCADVQACRQAALDAAARQDYESFHDLAWRAVQKGRRNDPELMYLLARAQSLSGRPGDALVMLQRLAQMGIATDAATNDDFRRVRALPAWKTFLEQQTYPEQPSTPATPDLATPPARPLASGKSRASPSAETANPPPPKRSQAAAPSAMAGAESPMGSAAATTAVPENVPPSLADVTAMQFTAAPFVPTGLVYDSVSRRFLLADGPGRKLLVIDEPSRHVATLVSEASAGFGDITALEIDHREGDLWVTSADGTSSLLHKLQLVSGRLLYSISPPDAAGAVRFVDVALTPHSTVLALDADGSRVFALNRGARVLHQLARLEVEAPTSVAPAGDDVAYVAWADGIVRLDLGAHTKARVRAPHSIDLARFTRIRMHRRALVGIQRTTDGPDRLVRIRLNASGSAATAMDVLASNVAPSSEMTISMNGDVVFYLSSEDGETSVRGVKLK
jgi:hypothetical protein